MPTKQQERQLKFFSFLQSSERSNTVFTIADLSQVTGWKESSIKAYISLGHFDDVLDCVEKGKYKAKRVSTYTQEDFLRLISQSAKVKRKSKLDLPLSIMLAEKARENFVLALELYNRPSLDNRMDGFVTLYCMAWEQLLKAQIANSDGEEAIFASEFETIGLWDCIIKVFPDENNLIRKNLLAIKRMRDKAVHLLVPEVLAPASLIFQAGVHNFIKYYKAVVGTDLLGYRGKGLISLVVDPTPTDTVQLQANYGAKLANQISFFTQDLINQIHNNPGNEFSVNVKLSLHSTKNVNSADFTFSIDPSSEPTIGFVRDPKDPEKTHPYFQRGAVIRINERLHEIRSSVRISNYDFQAVVQREGWKKNTPNPYCYHYKSMSRFAYSESAVDRAVQLLSQQPKYLELARAALKKL